MALCCSCTDSSSHREVDHVSDPWMRRFPGTIEASLKYKRLDPSQFTFVRVDNQEDALKRLENTSVIVLDTLEARELSEGLIARNEGGVAVLLRGLVREKEEGSEPGHLELRWDGESVIVDFACNRRKPTSLVHQAVLAILPLVPKEVFVEETMVRHGDVYHN